MKTIRYKFLAAVLIVLVSMALSVFPQSTVQQTNGQQLVEVRDAVKAEVSQYLHHFKVQDKATQQDIDQIAELRLKILASTTSFTDRQVAFRELLQISYRLRGITQVPSEQIQNQIVQPFAQYTHGLVTNCDSRPVGATTTPASSATWRRSGVAPFR